MMQGSFSSRMSVIIIMAMASAPISCLTAGGMMTSASGMPWIPRDSAETMSPFLGGETTPRSSSMFLPAKARSRISMFWNSESWKGFPQTPILSTLDRSMFSSAKRLLIAPIMSPWATSCPAFMAKLTWSMTFMPGMGWRSVIAVATVFLESRSMAWQRNPLVPMSSAMPYLMPSSPS